jgi:hypothetical protein
MLAPIRRGLGARNQCTPEEHRVVLGRARDSAALRTNMAGQNHAGPPIRCRSFLRRLARVAVNAICAVFSRRAD